MSLDKSIAFAAILFAISICIALRVDGQDPGFVATTLALVAFSAFVLGQRGSRDTFNVGVLDVVVAAFFIWVAAATVLRDLPWVANYQLTVIALLPAGYALARMRSECADVWIPASMVALATILSLVSIVLVSIGEDPNVVFPVRNTQAAFIGISFFLAIALSNSRWLREPARWAPVVFLLAAGFAICGSRGGMVAVSCALVAGFLVGPVGRRIWALRRLAVGAIGFTAGNLLTSGWVARRVAAIPSGTGIRAEMWLSALPLVEGEPLFGHGLGMTQLVWAPFRSFNDSSLGIYLHNDYLQFMVEAGIPATILLVAIPVTAIWVARRRSDRGVGATMAFAAVAMLSVHSIVDYHLQVPIMALSFGTVLGLLASHEKPRRPIRFTPRYMTWATIALLVFLTVHAVRMILYQSSFPGPDTRDTHVADTHMWSVMHYSGPGSHDRLWRRARALESALKYSPRADEAWILYGATLRELGVLEESEEALRRAARLNPYTAQAAYQLALVALQRADERTAEELLFKAVSMDPRFLAGRAALFDLLMSRDRVSEAYMVVRPILELRRLKFPFELRYIIENMEKMAHERNDYWAIEQIEWNRERMRY